MVVKIATTYPGATDTFNVPSSPTTTPLSSAGTGTRNHVSHHRDLGDAVMAIQNNATKSTHNHDSTGLNGPKLDQANTHQNVDTDAAGNSLHHTLGTNPTQAAAGNHVHDSRYVRMDGSVDQLVTGKKTFPSGTSSIAIPDFQNATHHHLNTGTDGGWMANTGASINNYHGNDVGRNGSPLGGNVTEDMYLHFARFTLPAFTALVGTVAIHYYIEYNTGNPGVQLGGDRQHNAFFYVSHNEGESPAFSQSKNVLLNGGNFNGKMFQSDHLFNTSGATEGHRIQFQLPIYMPATTVDTPNIALVMRVANTSNGWLNELNWGLQLTFQSHILVL